MVSARSAVCEEQVHTHTHGQAAALHTGNALSDGKQVGVYLCIQFGETCGMPNRRDQYLARIDGVDIHEGAALVDPVNDVGGLFVGNDVAERAMGVRGVRTSTSI